MSHEIYYTSAPEGLKRGTSGFSTVAASENIPKALWDRLETLSAYRHVGGAEGGGAINPTAYAHWILTVTGKTHHVLSRICDSGVDHTQRTNAFAHHIVLDTAEIEAAAGGPAWMLNAPGVMMDRWDGRVGALSRARMPTGDGHSAARICTAWAAATGDAGWGGHLADLFAKSPTRPVCILFSAEQDILPLVAEAVALLPPAARWNVTFNTYFTSMPTSATCLWRCCLARTPAAEIGMRYAAGGLVLNLTDPARLPAVPDGPYVNVARTGVAAEAPRAAKPVAIKPPIEAPRRKKPTVMPPSMDEEDVEDLKRQESIFDFANDAAGAASVVKDLSSAEPREFAFDSAAPAGGRAKPIPARMFRRADEALEEAERQAARAAQRRRRQVMFLFVAAVAAIGIGTALILISKKHGAPPEPAPVVANRLSPTVDPPPIPETPTPIRPTPVAPPPDTRNDVAIVDTPPPEPTPVAPTPLAPVYPDVLTTLAALERPKVGTGLNDPDPQMLPVRAADLDPATVTDLRFKFPTKSGTKSSDSTFFSSDTGTLTTKSDARAGQPGVTLSWKAAGDRSAPDEIVHIGWDKNRKALDVKWHAAPLFRNPSIFNLVYWLWQSGAVELASAQGQKQEILLKPLAPTTLDFSAKQADLKWPAGLPSNVMIAIKNLPEGWQAESFVDWDPKLKAAERNADNASRVIKFKKGEGPVDPFFLLTFHAGLSSYDCNFAKQLQDRDSERKTIEDQLGAINDQINEVNARIKRYGGSVDPALQKSQTDATAKLDAYKTALAGYNEMIKFDVSFEMPDGVQLTTAHFERPSKEQGK